MVIPPLRPVGAAQPVARASAPDAFSVPHAAAQTQTQAATPMAPSPQATAVSAGLFALQIDQTDRRRRAVLQGTKALDALAKLERALAGAGGAADVKRALDEAAVAPEEADEPQLSALLREIETRRAVEAAKLERRGSPLLDRRSEQAI